jgi:hypothetical protein
LRIASRPAKAPYLICYGSCAIQPLKIRDETNGRAAAPYVHAKISPENTKTTDTHITLLQLVMGSYELEAAEKAKQIEGQVVKRAPAE